MHPSETAGEKEEELTPKPTPPDTPPDDMKKKIQDLHPELFGMPKPGEHQKKPKAPKDDPRKNTWLANDPTNPGE